MSFKGKKHTDEWKTNMAERTRQRMNTPAMKRRVRAWACRPRPAARGSNPNKARFGNRNVLGKRWTLTPERRTQISKTMRGRAPPPHSGRGRTGYRDDIGFFVRSTWEANFARLLIVRNIPFEYECCSFDLGSELGTHRPDFYLPTLHIFIEVKGYETSTSRAKHLALLQLGVACVVLDSQHYRRLERKYSTCVDNWEKS